MDIKIEGIKETLAVLEQAPKNIVARGFLKALQAAAKPIERQLDLRIPVDTGSLKRKRKTKILLDANYGGGVMQINYGDLTYIVHFLEYGHRAMRGAKSKGQKNLHTFVRAHPFVRAAVASSIDEALDAFAESLAESIEGGILENVA